MDAIDACPHLLHDNFVLDFLLPQKPEYTAIMEFLPPLRDQWMLFQGLTTMMYRTRTAMNGLGYAWKALERCFSSAVTEKISWMTFCVDRMVKDFSSRSYFYS